MKAFEAVQATDPVDPGFEKNAFLVPPGHPRHHLRQIGDPGVFLGFREAGQTHAVGVGQGEHRVLRQMGVVENAAKIVEVKIGDQEADGLIAGVEHRLAELDHDAAFGFEEGVFADGKRSGMHGAAEKIGFADARNGNGWRGNQDAAVDVGQRQGHIGGVARQNVGQQGLAGGGVKAPHFRGFSQGHQQEAGVVHHPLVVCGHGLHLAQGIGFRVVNHPAAQFATGIEQNRQGRQHGQQHQNNQTFADRTKEQESHRTPEHSLIERQATGRNNSL